MCSDQSWTDEQKRLLADRWHSSITCEEIGALCGGRTKNAVISQATRMKLGPKPRGRQKMCNHPVVPHLFKRVLADPRVVASIQEIAATGVGLVDLEDGMCHWPLPGTGEIRFCGFETHDKYCEEHTKQAHQRKQCHAA